MEPIMCWASTGSGRIELELSLTDARAVTHSGPCDDDVEALSRVEYVARQLALINPWALKDELHEYGAWTEEELVDHDQSLQRILWLLAGDIAEENLDR